MARDIPGYYFDPERGKYFKIQPNHAVPSAAKHSKEVVDAREATLKKRKLDGELKNRHAHETVLRSKLLQHPLMNRLHIKNAVGGVHGFRSNVMTELAAYYGAGLSRRTVLTYSYPRLCVTKFAIDEVTASIIMTTTGASNIVVHHGHFPRTHHRDCPPNSCFAISAVNNPVTALLITPRPASYIFWATSATHFAPGTVRIMPFCGEQERAAALRLETPNDLRLPMANYNNMGISWSIPESDIWDLAASPSGRIVVAACSSGLRIFGSLDRGLTDLMRKTTDREYMAASFKDESTVFCGTRAGAVPVVDLRSHAGTTRLRHGSGVAAVRALSNDNYVLVRGLQKMSIYDLRFTPLSNSLSKPYMDFQGSHLCDRFGLGFDYDPGLGLIAVAHSGAARPGELTGNRVSLFSTRTGKIVPSPINSHPFPAPVSCIQFTNAIRSRCANPFGEVSVVGGRPLQNNEPKSIVTASGGSIDEWTVQGLGDVDEGQE